MRRNLSTADAAAVCLILLLGGCAPAEQSAGHWRGTRQLLQGVEIVRNPATPLNNDRMIAQPLWASPSDEAVSLFGEWENPASLAQSGDRLYVLDRTAHRIYAVHTEDGSVHNTLGRRGRGPGEFERPFGVVVNAGYIIVGNGAGGSLERFRLDGTFEGKVETGRLGFRLLSLPTGELYLNSMLGSEAGWSRVREDGTLSAVEWPDPVGLAFDDCIRVGGGDDVLIRTSCTRPLLQIISAEGEPIREVMIDRPALELDPALFEAHAANVRNTMAQSGMPQSMIEEQLRSQRERLSPVPVIRRAHADAASQLIALWEQQPDDFGEHPATLHVLAETGEYLARYVFAESWADFVIHDGRLYVLTRDADTGITRLKAYDLQLPPFTGA